MNNIIKNGQGLIYMKVGTHAKESLEDIIERKTKEIKDAGMAFWGYGGNTCHPATMVQPFAKSYEKKGSTIYLIMQPMESKHFAEQIRANEYSINGKDWIRIPEGINVLGSRFALVINNLQRKGFDFELENSIVALGNSKGAQGHNYIRGRVDKACLEIIKQDNLTSQNGHIVNIGLIANVIKPYAVFVRNQ